MTYYSITIERTDVFFFYGKKRRIAEAKKEAQIQNIRKDMFKKIDKTNKSIDKLTELYDKEDIDIAGMIYLATHNGKNHV